MKPCMRCQPTRCLVGWGVIVLKSKSYRLLEIHPDARTYALLARTLDALGLKAEAAKAYMLASDQGGQSASDYLIEGIRLHFAAGNKNEALALSSRLPPKLRMAPDVAFVIASIMYERRQLKLAAVFKEILMKSDKLEHMQLGVRIPYTGRIELGGRNQPIIEAGGMEKSISAWTYNATIDAPTTPDRIVAAVDDMQRRAGQP